MTNSPRGQLIVNADDFGLTSGVNRGIIELHSAGLVTSTSLMARAGATDEAIDLARATPALGVGCHVVLVDGEPVLPPDQIPTLIDSRTGNFPHSLNTFLLRLFTGRISAAEVEAEAGAQIDFLQQRGIHLTHIDTHKHTHVLPQVLHPVLRAARARGIGAIRNPFEPKWSIHATPRAQWLRTVQVSALRWLEPFCCGIIAKEGFATTGGTVAVIGTGILDCAMLRSMLASLPTGTWELVTHPGYNDADLECLRTRLRASRDGERDALTTLKEFPGIKLISFAELQPGSP